ncbi:Pre-mRNA-splicing factor Syf2 [Malassezia pachydermatis]
MIDFQDLAERSYQRQLKTLTPDLAAYAKQKEAEAQSTTTPSEQTSTALTTTSDSQQALVPAKEAKVSAAVASYGTHKPDEDSIDRLVSHLNHEQDQIRHRSRRREDDLDVEGTYINQRNKRFNRKIQRYFGEHTKELRENLERGTAL